LDFAPKILQRILLAKASILLALIFGMRQRLVQAGCGDADVGRFESADLLAYYAKVMLAETAYVPPPQRGDDVLLWRLVKKKAMQKREVKV